MSICIYFVKGSVRFLHCVESFEYFHDDGYIKFVFYSGETATFFLDHIVSLKFLNS